MISVEISGPHSRPLRLVVAFLLSLATCAPAGANKSAIEPGSNISPSDGASDPFEWLESRNSATALDWVRAQNEKTISALKVDSRFRKYYETALKFANEKSILPGVHENYSGSWIYDGWVYQVFADDSHPYGQVKRARVDTLQRGSPRWEFVFDVDAFDRLEGKKWSLQTANCFRSHCLLDFLTGKKRDAIREFDLNEKKIVEGGFNIDEAIMPVWKDENTIVLSADFGPNTISATGNPLEVREWVRGTPISAARILYKASSANVSVAVFAIGGYENLEIQEFSEGTGQLSAWRLGQNGQLEKLSLPRVDSEGYYNGNWVGVLDKDWVSNGRRWSAGSIISVPIAEMTSTSPDVTLVMSPVPREVVDSIAATSDGVLAITHENVLARLWRYTLRRGHWTRTQIPMPDNGDIHFLQFSRYAEPLRYVVYESFLQPPTLYGVDVLAARVRKIASRKPQFDSSHLITEQHEAISADGTRVPYFLVRSKSIHYNGKTPTLLHAYGGNGLNQYPHYDGLLGRLWLDEGGAYVVANIRGGGELGPNWHYAAVKTNRVRSFDDFIAVTKDLFRRRITSPRRLGIHGHSNGGGLVTVMMTQHPELFHAVVAENGVLDWIRTDLQSSSVLVEQERGSPRIPQERAFLDRISPYQNLVSRGDMPVPFLVTNTTDTIVYPAMTRKFAAKMLQLGLPYYFYEAPEGDHGQFVTPPEEALYEALKYTYLARELRDAVQSK